MRNHSDIVRDAGPDPLSALTGASIHTVRSWLQRDSIPSEYWATLISANHCTAEELITAAALKRTTPDRPEHAGDLQGRAA